MPVLFKLPDDFDDNVQDAVVQGIICDLPPLGDAYDDDEDG
jgi:hypothetical protein